MLEEVISKLYERINHNLEVLAQMDLEDPHRKELVAETDKLRESVQGLEHEITDSYDRDARRSLERERFENELAVERTRQSVSLPKIGLEIAKVVVPAVISAGVYLVAQKRAIIFEESGRFCSKSSQWLGLPKR